MGVGGGGVKVRDECGGRGKDGVMGKWGNWMIISWWCVCVCVGRWVAGWVRGWVGGWVAGSVSGLVCGCVVWVGR